MFRYSGIAHMTQVIVDCEAHRKILLCLLRSAVVWLEGKDTLTMDCCQEVNQYGFCTSGKICAQSNSSRFTQLCDARNAYHSDVFSLRNDYKWPLLDDRLQDSREAR